VPLVNDTYGLGHIAIVFATHDPIKLTMAGQAVRPVPAAVRFGDILRRELVGRGFYVKPIERISCDQSFLY